LVCKLEVAPTTFVSFVAIHVIADGNTEFVAELGSSIED
jgi:hypothetical protein